MSAFFPALAPARGVAFEEIARRHGDYALCRRRRAGRRATTGARRRYLSVSDVPTVVDLTRRCRRSGWGEAALEQLDPADDIHATAAYRAQLVRVLTARVVRAAYDDAKARAA